MKKTALIVYSIPFLLSCSGNILSELSSQTTDAALYEEAKIKINDKNYAAAKTACQSMSATATSNRDYAYVCAAAYAGACGLDFLTLITAVDGYTLGTPNFMVFLLQMNDFATSAEVTDCVAATDLLQGIGAAASRTAEENLLMVLTNLQTLGVVGNLLADTNNDDAVDGGFDTCADVNDAQATYVAEAYWEMEASAALTGNTDLAAFGTAINAACVILDAVNAANDFCAAADTASFTADQLKGARGLMRETTAMFGLGDCGGNPGTCICP